MDGGCWDASGLYPTSIKEDQIRLVHLNRARHWQDGISCKLRTERLLGKQSPTYKALSYAWGSTKTKHTIMVNEMPVGVTVNLESALRHIRQTDEDVVLWIDALCINQADNTERRLQVANMCEIYRAAIEVIVFLGDGNTHRIQGHSRDQFPGPQVVFDHSSSDDALTSQFLKRWETPAGCSAQALDIISLLRLLASPQCDSLRPLEPLNTSNACLATLFEALRMMMLCAWWDRMWVVQEIIVAKKVTFQYGRVSAPWSVLTAAALAHTRYDSLPHEYKTVLGFYSRRVIDIENRRQTWKTNKQTALLSLLREFSDRRASDDRDKIYALLGLCSESTLVVPDYSLEVASTYMLATLDAIVTTRTLSVLNGDLGRKNRQDLPSWVPDWSATFDEHDRRRADLFDGLYNSCKGKISYIDSSHGHWGPRAQYAPSDASHVSRQLGYLLDSLRAAPDVSLLLPQCYRAVFESYASTRHIVEITETCKELAELCHPKGCLPIYMAADEMSIRETDGYLYMRGHYLDTVKAISEPLFSSTDVGATRVAIPAWWHFLGRHQSVPEAALASKSSFATTLVADTTSTVNGLRRLRRADMPALMTWVEDLIDPTAVSTASHAVASETETLDSFTHAMRMAATRRVFFVTKRGKMGLGPASARIGDKVYVLPGGEAPFILRHWKGNQYSLIGDCYLEGAMGTNPRDYVPTETLYNHLPTDVVRHMAGMWKNKVKKLMWTNPEALERAVRRGTFRCSAFLRWWESYGAPQVLGKTSAGSDESPDDSTGERWKLLKEMQELDGELFRMNAENIIIV